MPDYLRRKKEFSKLSILKTSLKFQTREFFENSTLHGVRYLAEKDRPTYEKVMWFTFVVTGAIVTLLIIASLWEKFQTNPTITGLDTDFHSWDVPFPSVTVCLSSPASASRVEEYIAKYWGNDLSDGKIQNYTSFINAIANFSYMTLEDITKFRDDPGLPQTNYRQLLYDVVLRCEDFLSDCDFKNDLFDCCKIFIPTFTEYGYCYSFNARYAEKDWPWKPATLKPGLEKIRYIFETDVSWSIKFLANIEAVDSESMSVYIHSNNELPGLEMAPQHVWVNQIATIHFAAQTTYTTDDVRQLTIKQRKCIFKDEVALKTAPEYSYWACMSNCRMENAMKLCSCVPFFHHEVPGFPYCNLSGLNCLAQFSGDLIKGKGCSCELGCDNTVYEVEKLADVEDTNYTLEVGFVSWPMIRYKREVLFGWVDLLVAFGGIAGLFLGFSLLSGVEVIYYFTLRAACMAHKNSEELVEMKLKTESQPLPKIDLSLKPSMDTFNANSRTNKSQSSFVNQVVGRSNVKKGKHFLKQQVPQYNMPFLN